MNLRDWAAERAIGFRGSKFAAVIPDPTRSGGTHVGSVLRGIYDAIGGRVSEFKVLIALGTHGAVSDADMQKYLGITAAEFSERMPKLELVNHAWWDENALVEVGNVSRDQWRELSNGVMDLADFGFPHGIRVRFNRLAVEADDLCIVGPVLPHEVVGMSGGYKYFSPGIGARELTALTHWVGAAVTIPHTIGKIETPVRRLVEHCGQMIRQPNTQCVALVVEGDELRSQFFGDPITAHRSAAMESLKHNVRNLGRTFRRVVGVLAPYYPELWTGGKASYKLIQLVEPGGELIIYAPHLNRVSSTWGEQIERIGYHSLAYVQARLREFLEKGISPAVLAHVTHVFGHGTFEHGVESPSVVKLATALSESFCRDTLNLGFIDPRSLDLGELRSNPNTLVVDDAGQRLVLPTQG